MGGLYRVEKGFSLTAITILPLDNLLRVNDRLLPHAPI